MNYLEPLLKGALIAVIVVFIQIGVELLYQHFRPESERWFLGAIVIRSVLMLPFTIPMLAIIYTV